MGLGESVSARGNRDLRAQVLRLRAQVAEAQDRLAAQRVAMDDTRAEIRRLRRQLDMAAAALAAMERRE